MKKQTLCFSNLRDLLLFSKEITMGYLVNTANLTLTSPLDEVAVLRALQGYGATAIDTCDKVYSYDWFPLRDQLHEGAALARL